MVWDKIIAKACHTEGLEFLGIAQLGPEGQFQNLKAWLAAGNQASMNYLERHQHLRADPRGLLENAGSAIIFGLRYGPLRELASGPRIAAYAHHSDYHKVMRQKGERTWKLIQEQDALALSAQFRVCIDSAPILERALAARTRAGFIGKNTCYIRPGLGSYLLLGEIITSLKLTPDVPEVVSPDSRSAAGGCGSCRRCQVHCPTQALDSAYHLDARRCLSYWTIEHRGTIPREFWPHMARYWYGCDICQNVCPYNRVDAVAASPAPQIDLFEVAQMNQATYERLFGGSAMTRAKRSGLRRNATIALYVTKDTRWLNAVAIALTDPDEVLKETAREIVAAAAAECGGASYNLAEALESSLRS